MAWQHVCGAGARAAGAGLGRCLNWLGGLRMHGWVSRKFIPHAAAAASWHLACCGRQVMLCKRAIISLPSARSSNCRRRRISLDVKWPCWPCWPPPCPSPPPPSSSPPPSSPPPPPPPSSSPPLLVPDFVRQVSKHGASHERDGLSPVGQSSPAMHLKLSSELGLNWHTNAGGVQVHRNIQQKRLQGGTCLSTPIQVGKGSLC